MKMNAGKWSVRIALLSLLIFCTVSVTAQLDTSAGGSLSQPLLTNLYGTTSAATPTPSTQIEPGANNLLNPEDRVLPRDAIGASLEATPMNPSVIEFYPLLLSRSPYQIDTSVKDETSITGVQWVLAANITDVIRRKRGNLEPVAPASSFGSPSAPLTGLLQGRLKPVRVNDLPEPNTPQSFWRVGGAAATQQAATSSVMPSAEPAQPQPGQSLPPNQTGLKSVSKANSLTLKTKKQEMLQSDKRGRNSELASKTPDYNKSPLEAPAYGDQNAAFQAQAGPFERLNQSSFLNPDITLSSPRRHLSRRAGMLSSASTSPGSQGGQGFFMRERSDFQRLNRMTKTGEIPPGQARSMKLSGQNKTALKPKWHNPILQQMEAGSNPGQP